VKIIYTTGFKRFSSTATAWSKREFIISSGNSASTNKCNGSLRCSYPGLSLSFSSYNNENIGKVKHIRKNEAVRSSIRMRNKKAAGWGIKCKTPS